MVRALARSSARQPVHRRVVGLGVIPHHALQVAPLVVLLLPTVRAVTVNITVDDTFGNIDGSVIPTYLPANDTFWHAGSPSELCDICVIEPSWLDASQIVNKSWHHAIYGKSDTPVQVQVVFPGTAVYVYNIIPNTFPDGSSTLVNISFALDGKTVGEFKHFPNASSEISYHQLVYSHTNLSDSSHTFIMSASGIDSEPSLILFDYLVYTTEVEDMTSATATQAQVPASGTSNVLSSPATTASPATPPSEYSSTRTPTATIVGGVLGGIALLVLLALFPVFYQLRLRRRQAIMAKLDFVSPRPITPSITTSESFFRPLSTQRPLSNAVTIAGETLFSIIICLCPTSGILRLMINGYWHPSLCAR